MMQAYIYNEDGTLDPVDGIIRAMMHATDNDTRVRKHTRLYFDKILVSTAFLVVDHRCPPFDGEGPPLIFEVMVFGGYMDLTQARFSDEKMALAYHDAMVAHHKTPWGVVCSVLWVAKCWVSQAEKFLNDLYSKALDWAKKQVRRWK